MNINRETLISIRKFVTSNTEWLLTSLVLGSVIWLVAALDENPVEQREYSEAIAIDYVQDQDGDVIRDTSNIFSTLRVRVTIRAPRDTWQTLRSEDIRVFADIENLPAGTHTVELEGELLGDLRGRIISISPQEVDVRLVNVTERILQLEPETSNPLPVGYESTGTTCDPERVLIRGPETRVNQVASAVTRLNLSELTDTTTINGSVILFDSEGRTVSNVTVDPSVVLCQVDVQQRTDVKVVQVNAQINGEPASGFSLTNVSVEPTEITVTGNPDVLESLDSIETSVINIDGEQGNITRIPDLILPDGIQLQQSTQQITVTIDIDENLATATFTQDITVTNLDIGLEVELASQSATVSITAPQSIINELTADDISLSVDLANLGEGVFEETIQFVPLRETLQESQPDVTIQPATISVTIRQQPLPTPTPEPFFGKGAQ